MAGIEKVCEMREEGHWYDDFVPYNDKGISIYLDNIQACIKCRKKITLQAKGKKHIIKIAPLSYAYDPMYGKWSIEESRDFRIEIENVPCLFTGKVYWERWFYDLRRFKRNMRRLLGVDKLNIKIDHTLVTSRLKILRSYKGGKGQFITHKPQSYLGWCNRDIVYGQRYWYLNNKKWTQSYEDTINLHKGKRCGFVKLESIPLNGGD